LNDFTQELRRIEFQAALLADNPEYSVDLESAGALLREKSTDLLTAVVKFFNSALLYFSKGFFGNVLGWFYSYIGRESLKYHR
jgi:hypothetical protein